MLKQLCAILAFIMGLYGTHPFAAIIGKDDRQTLEDFAKGQSKTLNAMRRRFGATLAIACQDMQGQTRVASASLVERDDLVLTVAHLLMGPQGPQVASIDLCRVMVHDGKQWQAHEIDRWSVSVGARRVTSPDPEAQYDWMVLRTLKPISSVTPYRLDPALMAAESLQDKPVINVAAAHKNFKPAGHDITLWINPHLAPIVAPCLVRDIAARPDGGALLRTDCDTGVWASGSPVLVDEGHVPTLVGMIVSGGLESRNGSVYDSRLNASVAVHLSGPILTALRGLKVVAERKALENSQ